MITQHTSDKMTQKYLYQYQFPGSDNSTVIMQDAKEREGPCTRRHRNGLPSQASCQSTMQHKARSQTQCLKNTGEMHKLTEKDRGAQGVTQRES